MTRTVQLRRYEVAPDHLDDFLEWWRDRLWRARLEHGFSLEFAVLDREASVFTWAVSLPVDAAEFEVRDTAWSVSPERMDALCGTPQRVTRMDVSLVEPFA